MDKHDIPFLGDFYTKSEVDEMVAAALAEAKAIDEASMRKHNRDATIISMILGFILFSIICRWITSYTWYNSTIHGS